MPEMVRRVLFWLMHTFPVDYATTDKLLEEMGWEVIPYRSKLVPGDSH
jgi:hypothetical protein